MYCNILGLNIAVVLLQSYAVYAYSKGTHHKKKSEKASRLNFSYPYLLMSAGKAPHRRRALSMGGIALWLANRGFRGGSRSEGDSAVERGQDGFG